MLKNYFRKNDAPKKYSFDVSKANEIFDQLMKEGLIKLPNGVTLPSYEELKGKSYCKWHNAWSHSTNNCLVFQDRIQD